MKMLGKMQRRAAIWILEAFKMSPSFSVEAIARLISINLYLQKLSGRSQLYAHSLPNNHILRSLMEPKSVAPSKPHSLSLGSLSKWQCKLIKDPVVDMDNQFNKIFPSFDPLNPEFTPRYRVIYIFSNRFSFHLFSKCNEDNLKSQIHQLDGLAIKSSSNPSYAFIIVDTSIKNNVATSIFHIHIHNKPLTKTLHYTVKVTSIEAELFAIRCGINQAINSTGISKIIIITDSIHAARKIFDPSSHPLQDHAAIILKELRIFFLLHQKNSIEFWECPSQCNWSFHKVVNKLFNLIPLFLCKSSWDFSKKSECDDLSNRWKMTFQASDLKEKNFLDLLNDDNFIKPLYIKDRS